MLPINEIQKLNGWKAGKKKKKIIKRIKDLQKWKRETENGKGFQVNHLKQ